jgi:hypothetical protein
MVDPVRRRRGEVVKRIRLLILLGVVAAALVVPTAAKAWDSGTTNQVTIQQYADYDAAGLVLDVGLYVRCQKGPDGLVEVTVDQYRPQTTTLIAHGEGASSVVCDGNTHAVGVTIVGEGFDAGQAKAKATFTPNPVGGKGSKATAQRWITIIVV